MSPTPWTLEIPSSRRVRVSLRGALPMAAAAELKTAVALARPQAELLIDLRQLGASSEDLEQGLILAHADWRARFGRTAWLADRPCLRGLALRVLTATGDRESAVVGSEALAERSLKR